MPLAAPGLAGSPVQRGVRANVGVDHRMQQLVELFGIHAEHGGRGVDRPFVHHVGGDAHGGRRGALAGARLQQVERPRSTVNSMSCMSR